MHQDCIDSRFPIPTNRLLKRLAPRWPTNLLTRFLDWRERARGRHLLRQLDDRMLRDIGLGRSDVDRDCAKHFWQA
jgi:uncharacterized protein YjiS (DUF1127 family)